VNGRPALRRLAVLVPAAALAGCTLLSPSIHPTQPGPPSPEQMAQFWVEPDDLGARDLFWGPGGREQAPRAEGRWEFVSRKSTGYSRGFKARDENGIVWSIKVGDEAQSEVVSSRLMWALGYHQVPVYYVRAWTLSGPAWAGPKEPGRFRPAPPDLKELGDWSWHQNIFVGTPAWRGALVMMAMLNNCDLKPSQNALYELPAPREGTNRWYVVQDLGLSLGGTKGFYPRRNDIATFERTGFILGVDGNRVRFDYSGLLWKELFRGLTPEDVRWTCSRLARLSDRQWEDAFRAAAYEPSVAARYIRRFHQKIEQGLRLTAAGH
jgi:hypothetical protein